MVIKLKFFESVNLITLEGILNDFLINVIKDKDQIVKIYWNRIPKPMDDGEVIIDFDGNIVKEKPILNALMIVYDDLKDGFQR